MITRLFVDAVSCRREAHPISGVAQITVEEGGTAETRRSGLDHLDPQAVPAMVGIDPSAHVDVEANRLALVKKQYQRAHAVGLRDLVFRKRGGQGCTHGIAGEPSFDYVIIVRYREDIEINAVCMIRSKSGERRKAAPSAFPFPSLSCRPSL